MKIPLDLSEMMSNGKYEREIPLGLSEMMPNGKYELKIPLDLSKEMPNGKYELKIPLDLSEMMSNGKKPGKLYFCFPGHFLLVGLGFISQPFSFYIDKITSLNT